MKGSKLPNKSVIKKNIKDQQDSQSLQDQLLSPQPSNLRQVGQQINWKTLSKSKRQIQKLITKLIPKYFQYQQYLYQVTKQIVTESNMKNYDPQKLKPNSKKLMDKIQKKDNQIYYSLQEKTSMVQRVINERRIKKYYKKKHEINFQDELDPQNDEQYIYKFYNEVFNGQIKNKQIQQQHNSSHHYSRQATQRNNMYQLKKMYQPILTQQNQQYHQINVKPPLPLNNKNTFGVDKNQISFQELINNEQSAIKINQNDKHKINNIFSSFQDNLSFQAINQQPQSIRSFQNNGLQIINQDQQDGFDSKYRQKNQEVTIKKMQNSEQIFKKYIDKQNQQLGQQKLRMQQLTQKALKVLNNQDQSQQNHQQQIQDQSSKFKYLFNQIIQIYSVIQSLKYYLKYKSFQLLNKLYQHASSYYKQNLPFNDPIQRRYFQGIIKALIPNQTQEGLYIILQYFFKGEETIAFDQFIEKFTPLINDKEFQMFEEVDKDTSSNRLLDMTLRFFNLLIELDYFQWETKKILQNNQNLVDYFIDQNSQNGLFMIPQKIAQYITKNKKNIKVRKIKCEIYLRKILGQKMLVSQFYRWIGSKQKQNYKQVRLYDLNYTDQY